MGRVALLAMAVALGSAAAAGAVDLRDCAFDHATHGKGDPYPVDTRVEIETGSDAASVRWGGMEWVATHTMNGDAEVLTYGRPGLSHTLSIDSDGAAILQFHYHIVHPGYSGRHVGTCGPRRPR